MQLERMDAFFEARLDGYEAHMLKNIVGAAEFYPFTAQQLPSLPGAAVLDLGCGTGLELRWYYERNPAANITGIDLSAAMLDVLRQKYGKYRPTLICCSYFDVPFEKGTYDAAVSVESLHHFTEEEKLPLYCKLRSSLKTGGYFILTDYFAASDEEERLLRENFMALKREQSLPDDRFYHYDTPLTVEHEIRLLKEAGFSQIQILNSWGATYTLKAVV